LYSILPAQLMRIYVPCNIIVHLVLTRVSLINDAFNLINS
jgi:hypothetical protein